VCECPSCRLGLLSLRTASEIFVEARRAPAPWELAAAAAAEKVTGSRSSEFSRFSHGGGAEHGKRRRFAGSGSAASSSLKRGGCQLMECVGAGAGVQLAIAGLAHEQSLAGVLE